MRVIDDLLRNADRYATDPEHGYHATDKTAEPGRGLAIVACMDARLRLFSLLGLDEGDAHIIRNAGGVVTDDVIRSLSVSQHVLNTVDVLVIQHTDCGLTKTTDEAFDALMREHAGHRPSWGLRTITDLEASVRESVASIRESPFLVHRGEVRGAIFDVATGELTEVS
ncbi:beta-class carbonic anhydrase [Paraconexibacter sp.]|uniref:beta-class carbonic anhydrase n=1 Tax=Paraconexibacter sp. TaxID=2949640 RepID=UPI003562A87B